MNIRKLLKTLWKNISLADWLFIGIGILLLIGFYVFFKRDVVYITARFKVTDENALYARNFPNNEYATAFTVGDAEKDLFGRPIAEITGVEAFKVKPEEFVVYLDMRLKAVYDPRKHIYSSQGKNVLFGEVFTFSLNKTKFKALVVDFPGFSDNRKIEKGSRTVKAQVRYDSRYYSDTYGIPDFLARSIKQGDTVTDTKGTVLVKILDVGITPAKRVVVSNTGQPFIVNDPDLKDVYYTLELATTTIQGQTYMFGYIPVAINAMVPINLPSVFMLPTITEIIE